MRAIILAAGMGTRLRPLTLKTPKPLIPVQGEPMAERQIKFLQEKGIFPAYHMSKTCWISVLLDGSVSDETLSFLIDVSFELTSKKSKK